MKTSSFCEIWREVRSSPRSSQVIRMPPSMASRMTSASAAFSWAEVRFFGLFGLDLDQLDWRNT
ncbi:hypothetical protein ABI_07080 [Asticcacaulis biprosthecium C19]|uniref:Uncharacterized protein n=1 Tax=Asticcacaulis biprosthecium C19 TaxID=715226 RepID=F4QLC9_9CAUL|nr:hypothetical protein ABI_07080 [Asticcacaulis biprosthecium C19]